MSLILIDETRCKRDGWCARECPAAIIRLKEDGYPEVIAGGERLCLGCGHCVAVCPHGALSHRASPLDASPPIDPSLRISEAQGVQFLRQRRSVRLYDERPVEREKIERLIDVARYAPTGGNSQSVQWLVIDDRGAIKEIARLTVEYIRRLLQEQPEAAAYVALPRAVAAWDAGYDAVLRHAPCLIVASAPQWAYNGTIDVTLALCYLDLMAPLLGLGTCWAGMLQRAIRSSPPVKEAVGIPEDHPHHYPMMLGYPKVKYYRLPERRQPQIRYRSG